MRIGPHQLPGRVLLAPMAGITDQVFRQLCRRWGAALATTEMIGSRPELRDTRKSRLRLAHDAADGPLSVQIAGWDPDMLADAARHAVDAGADIVDINMGCPAKKVCNRLAGSALLRNEALVGRILDAVVAAVDVPVTLKTRIGWSRARRNGLRVARIAEAAGIRALAVHGRTRECRFGGHADYDAIADIVAAVDIPVIANGDVTTPEQARAVLAQTGAAAVMIGRGARGRPWLFAAVNDCLAGRAVTPPSAEAVADTVRSHLAGLHRLYGEAQGLRVARKHLRWYLDSLGAPSTLWQALAREEDAGRQRARVDHWLATWPEALAA